MERLMFGWDSEVDAWSRFWRWNSIKICFWTCDMNSTLGSVVPLAMFMDGSGSVTITIRYIGTSAFVSTTPKQQKNLNVYSVPSILTKLGFTSGGSHMMITWCRTAVAPAQHGRSTSSTSCKLGSASTSRLLLLRRPLPPFRRLYRFGFWSMSS